MDFLNIENIRNVREIKLDHSVLDLIVNFYNYQVQRDGLTIYVDYGICLKLLSKTYPEVKFKRDKRNHKLVIRVKDSAAGCLNDYLHWAKDESAPYLMATIASPQYGHDSLDVAFREDGVGIIVEESRFDFFEHKLNIEKIKRKYNYDPKAINKYLKNHFIKHIGPKLPDPFFDPSEGRCDLYFEKGSRDELERLMRLFILTEPKIETKNNNDLVVLLAATENSEPVLDCVIRAYHSKRLVALANLAISENRPVGWDWQYNGGACHRESGYNRREEILEWNVHEVIENASSREKMAARHELKTWLEERGEDITRFDAMSER